eukprot:Platyproteum_vivax@DN870_c0_g1_i1.p1
MLRLISVCLLLTFTLGDVLYEDIKVYNDPHCQTQTDILRKGPFNVVFNDWAARQSCTNNFICFAGGANSTIKMELAKAANKWIRFPSNVKTAVADLFASCSSKRSAMSLNLADYEGSSCLKLPISSTLIERFRGSLGIRNLNVDGQLSCPISGDL